MEDIEDQLANLLNASFDSNMKRMYLEYARSANNDVNASEHHSVLNHSYSRLIEYLENNIAQLKAKISRKKISNDTNSVSELQKNYITANLHLVFLTASIAELKSEIKSLELENKELTHQLESSNDVQEL